MGTSTKLQAEEPPVELMGLHSSLRALCRCVPAFKGRSRTRCTKGQKEEKQFCREETSFPPPFFLVEFLQGAKLQASVSIDWPAGEQQLGFERFRFKFTLNSFETAPSCRLKSLESASESWGRVTSRLPAVRVQIKVAKIHFGPWTV